MDLLIHSHCHPDHSAGNCILPEGDLLDRAPIYSAFTYPPELPR